MQDRFCGVLPRCASLAGWFLASLVVPAVAAGQTLPQPAQADSVAVQAMTVAQDTVAAHRTVGQDTTRTGVRSAAGQLEREDLAIQGLAQDTTQAVEDDGVVRLEIDGLVVDETVTKLGRDFYDLFYGLWQAPEGAFNYTVTVEEKPVPNLGTRITVQVNDEIAFQAQLQPRYDMVESAARQAVFYTIHFLQNRAPERFTY